MTNQLSLSDRYPNLITKVAIGGVLGLFLGYVMGYAGIGAFMMGGLLAG